MLIYRCVTCGTDVDTAVQIPHIATNRDLLTRESRADELQTWLVAYCTHCQTNNTVTGIIIDTPLPAPCPHTHVDPDVARYTLDDIADMVHNYDRGCPEGKAEFLREIGWNPWSAHVGRTVQIVTTVEYSIGTQLAHRPMTNSDGDVCSAERALADLFAAENLSDNIYGLDISSTDTEARFLT